MEALDLEPVVIPLSRPDGWRMTAAAVEQASAAKPLHGILAMSPANPSGTMIGADALSALGATCRRLGLWFISDEIYHGLTYSGPASTALSSDDDAIIINSFSKYYCMTGWRIGWMVVPEAHVRRIERLVQNLFICAPHASQVAALAALDASDELNANLAVYRANRALMLEGLPRAGFTRIAPPDGAFYIYADVGDLTDDSRALSARILHEAGVAVTPGLDFDPRRGARTLRFSYAGSTADIAEGIRRLEALGLGR